MRRGVRKRKCACVCASGEVFCVHTPSFSELRLAGRETQLKKKTGWRSDLLLFLEAAERSMSVLWLCFQRVTKGTFCGTV